MPFFDEASTSAAWAMIGPVIAARQAAAAERDVQTQQEQAKQQVVTELKARDREVRTHEQAHAAVGRPFTGQPSYTYQAGPDGGRYAVGGEVPIDVSPVEGDPAATIAKMEIVKAAALAPEEPSSADRKIAALADANRARAQADLAAERAAERRGDTEAVDLRL